MLSSGGPEEGASSSASNQTINNASAIFKEIVNSTSSSVLVYTDTGDRCGANFCPSTAAETANPNLTPPSTAKIHLISGLYLACMMLAFVIVALGVDRMSR